MYIAGKHANYVRTCKEYIVFYLDVFLQSNANELRHIVSTYVHSYVLYGSKFQSMDQLEITNMII